MRVIRVLAMSLVTQFESDQVKGRTVNYKLSGPGADQPPVGRFSINDKGVIQVSQALDREEIAIYKIFVHALINGVEVESAAEMAVRVHDDNDNAPDFGPGTIRGSVTEGSAPGQLPGGEALGLGPGRPRHGAHGRRLPPRGPGTTPATRRLLPGRAHPGRSPANVRLDREAVSEFRLTVVATDCNGAPSGLSGTGTLAVRVVDVNDNAPTFVTTTVLASVAENELADPLVFLFVWDRDEVGTDGWRAVYSIVGGDDGASFGVRTDHNSNAAVVSVVKPLDYERQSSLELLVAVANRAPLATAAGQPAASTATVLLGVRDAPEGAAFEPPLLVLSAREEAAPGSALGEFRARDPDSQHHGGEIRYVLGDDPAAWIQVDPRTAVISTVGAIDRESPLVHNGLYTFTVLALQDGPPPRTATGTVELHILDVNDHAPVLTGALRRAGPSLPRLCLGRPSESLPLTASDADSPAHGPPFAFSLVDEPPGTAALWEVVTLNETSARLQARVNAYGGGGPPLGVHRLSVMLADRGGHGEARSVAVRVCRCWAGAPPGYHGEEEEETCFPDNVRRPGLGAGATAAIIISLLVVALVGLVAFLLPRPKRRLLVFHDGVPRGSLVRYNDEGGREEDKIPMPPSPMSITMELISSDPIVNSPTLSSPSWSITNASVPLMPE
ncbi:cadherin-2-like [Petromyzon marinus]|uniref:cadherin-2-like n=1 Tax=Petromyzon marinus TaxID=7757 RepID=UPI003F6F088F